MHSEVTQLQHERQTLIELHMSIKQRDVISKEDSSSLTVETVLPTYTINAGEGRNVAVIDIPNTSIQIRGMVVDTLLETAPDVYGPYTITNKEAPKCIGTKTSTALVDLWIKTSAALMDLLQSPPGQN